MATTPKTPTVVIAAKKAAAATETAAPTTRPVKIQATDWPIRNPETNVLYTKHAVFDIIDLNAPEALFERVQIDAKILRIIEG
jgi:hypothetical protein